MRKQNRSENLAGYLFITPILLGFLVFLIIPLLFSLVISFAKWDFMKGLSGIQFIGLDNFIRLFNDVWFTDSFINTIIFAFFTVPIQIILGLLLAVIINECVHFSNFFKIILFLPYISSIVASAIVWKVIFHPSYGPVTELIKSLGIENAPKWFADTKWALPLVIAFSIWAQLGYLIVVFTSGLKSIPKELYEAADVDGAGKIRKFFAITVPMVSPTTFFLFVMQMINSFKVFDQISVLTNGGPGRSTSVMAFYIYKSAFQNYEMGNASAAAWIMFVLIFIVTIIQWRGQKKWVNE